MVAVSEDYSLEQLRAAARLALAEDTDPNTIQTPRDQKVPP